MCRQVSTVALVLMLSARQIESQGAKQPRLALGITSYLHPCCRQHCQQAGESPTNDARQDNSSMPRRCLILILSEAAAYLAHCSTDAMCQASRLSGEDLASQQEGGGIGAKLNKE